MNSVDILGIDLGTTKSVIAVWDIEISDAVVIPNREGDNITPSVVTFDADSGQPIVGKPAVAQMLSHPHDVIYSIKRFIGRPPDDRWVKLDEQRVTYDVDESQQHAVVIRVAGRELTPSEVSAEVLRKLKNDAELGLNGRGVKDAVISVPAYFNDSQRRATQKAGELAGLLVHRIIPEPTAAALAFGLGAQPETVAVYDLGGGTFDISILRIEHGLLRVKAIGGDTHLGGDDFDQRIVEWMSEQFKLQHPGAALPTESDLHLRARLREEAKRAKIALTDAAETPIRLPDLLSTDAGALSLEATLTRTKLEELIRPLIEQSLQLVEETMQSAGFHPADLSQFLLVGGQTRTPAIKVAIGQRFGRPLNDSVKPEEAVARGAAILGARLRGHLRERINLWDALPLSLGIELGDGRMDVIIKGNEPIPVEKSKAFTNQRDGQEYIRFAIYQGERPIAVHNAYVGQVLLPLATSRRAGEHRIKCLFKVDANGILTVKAESADVEGKPVEMVFTYGGMSAEEIEARKRDADEHRDEDEITSRVLQLHKELTEVHTAISNRPADDPVLKVLSEVEAALASRDVDNAVRLMSEIRRML